MRLETERLLIRPFVPEDAAELFQVLSDPEVMRFLEPPFNWEQTEAFLQEAGFASPPLIYALERKDSGRLAGSCIFHPYDGPEEYELGWVLRRDCWGQGFAGEVTKALAARAGRMGLESLVIEFCLEQGASRKLAEKFGFRPAGTRDGLEVYRYSLKERDENERQKEVF